MGTGPSALQPLCHLSLSPSTHCISFRWVLQQMPRTWWLKTTHAYSLHAVLQGSCLEALEDNVSLPFQLPELHCSPCPARDPFPCLQSWHLSPAVTRPASSVGLGLGFLLEGHFWLHLELTTGSRIISPLSKPLNTPAKILFPCGVTHIWVPWMRT